MPLLGLEPSHDSDEEGIGRNAERGSQLVATIGGPMGAEPIEVHAIGDDGDRHRSSAFAVDLGCDRLRRGDQSIEECVLGGEGGNLGLGAHAARVDRCHYRLRSGHPRCASSEQLGAEHVGVEEVPIAVAEVDREPADQSLIIGLVEDGRRQAELAHSVDRGAIGQRHGLHGEPDRVQAEHEIGDAALRAAEVPGGQQLDHSPPRRRFHDPWYQRRTRRARSVIHRLGRSSPSSISTSSRSW